MLFQLRHQQPAMFQANTGNGQGCTEVAVTAITLVHSIIEHGGIERGKNHAETVGYQPIAFHHSREILVIEQVRIPQQTAEQQVQFPPLPGG